MFVPETFERYGFRLLFGGVDDRDVVQAAVLAMTHRPEGGFDPFNVLADVPFGPGDAAELHHDPQAVLERHWPGCGALFDERGLDVPKLIWSELLWPPTKAKAILGYRPQYSFTQFSARDARTTEGTTRSPSSRGGACRPAGSRISRR